MLQCHRFVNAYDKTEQGHHIKNRRLSRFDPQGGLGEAT